MKLKCDMHAAKEADYGSATENAAVMAHVEGEDIQTYVERIASTVCGSPFDCSDCGGSDTADNADSADGADGPSPSPTPTECSTLEQDAREMDDLGMLDDLNCHREACDTATNLYNTLTTQCANDDKA